MSSQTFEPQAQPKSGTRYLLQMVADSELPAEEAMSGREVLQSVENTVQLLDLMPVTGWVRRDIPVGVDVALSDEALIAAAKVLEGHYAQIIDPESDLWDPKFAGYEMPELVVLAESLVEMRKADAELRGDL